MIKILNRVTTAIAVGQTGVALSWITGGSGELFSTDSIPTAWNTASEDFSLELKSLVDKVGMRDSSVTLSLPDDICYTSILTFEELPTSLSERDKLIKWTVAKNLHIPEDALSIDYHLIGGTSKPTKILAVAIELKVVSQYEETLKSAGLNVWSVSTRLLNSLHVIGEATKGLSEYILLYYGNDYFTVMIFKNDCLDFIRTKSLSGVLNIALEVSATLKSYLGKNLDYESQKFFILTNNRDGLKDLDVEDPQYLDATLLSKTYNSKGDVPLELVLASIGSVKG